MSDIDLGYLARMIADMRREMETRFEGVDSRFGGIDSRFENIEGRLDAIGSDVLELRRQVASIVFPVNRRFREVEGRLTTLETAALK